MIGKLNREIKISILIMVGFLSFLYLEKPLRELLILAQFDEYVAKKVANIFIRSLLIIVAVLLINKLDFRKFVGFGSLKKTKNLQALIIPLAFMVMGVISSWINYINADGLYLLVFIGSVLAVGFVEEFVFRGIIFPLFILGLNKTKGPVIIAAVLSSLMFGMVHFVNLFRDPENLGGITSQVFFATSIGVFFCGLMIRTENILIPSILHALVNFSFGSGELVQLVDEVVVVPEVTGGSIIPELLFFTFILLGGVYMILKSDKEYYLNRLGLKVQNGV